MRSRARGRSSRPWCAAALTSRSRHGTKTISTRRATISRSCRFTITTSFRDRKRLPRTGRLKLTVRFLGNSVLLPVTAKARRVRAG